MITVKSLFCCKNDTILNKTETALYMCVHGPILYVLISKTFSNVLSYKQSETLKQFKRFLLVAVSNMVYDTIG